MDHVYIAVPPADSAFEAPLLVDSPHSGTFYPKDFDYSCAHNLLKRGEDLFVEELFAQTPQLGGYFLHGLFSRSYIDLNRSIEEMDLELCAEHWDQPTIKSERVKYGMGIIRRLAKPGVAVYSRKLLNHEIRRRLDHYYKPYHSKLSELSSLIHHKFGLVFHLNVHSMPSRTLEGDRHPDFVIGDRDGDASAALYTNFVAEFLRDHRFHVTINDPYKGVEIIRKYGNPRQNRHSIQIEINKALYMDEEKFAKSGDFQALQIVMNNLTQACASFAREQANLLVA